MTFVVNSMALEGGRERGRETGRQGRKKEGKRGKEGGGRKEGMKNKERLQKKRMSNHCLYISLAAEIKKENFYLNILLSVNTEPPLLGAQFPELLTALATMRTGRLLQDEHGKQRHSYREVATHYHQAWKISQK